MTEAEANNLWDAYLKGGEYPEATVLNEICEAWNKGDLKTNFLGGKGYRIRNGRIVHNDKEHTA